MNSKIQRMKNQVSYAILILCLICLSACKKNDDLTVNSSAQLEEKLIDQAEGQHLTSISYCVIKNDKILYSNAWGFADVDNKKYATDSTRYLIASISKTITAVALMQLVEQNLIALDDDINAFLPYPVRNPAFPNDKITYRMLLTHTSSISDEFQEGLDLDCYGSDCPMTLTDFYANVFVSGGIYFSADNFSDHAPGSHEDYSNLASALVGYLVERITNMPFDEYCKINIFTPLEMGKTEWRLANTPLSELAIPYSSDISDKNNPHYTFPDYPNGGLHTTVLDLSKFLSAIIQGGTFNGKQILSPATVASMKTLQFGSAEQCLSFYHETINGKDYLGHIGGEKGVTTAMYFDDATGLGVIVFNNDDDADLDNLVSLLFNYGEK